VAEDSMVLRRASPGLLVILRVYARRVFGKELHDLTREEYEPLVERLLPRHRSPASSHFHVRGPSLSVDAIPA